VNSAFEEMNLPEHEATLFIEAETDSQVDAILELCDKSGSSGHYLARDKADEEKLYNARAMVYLGIRAIGLAFHAEDVVVPLDRLTEYLGMLKQVSKKFNLRIPVGGHAGDGNLHPIILYDKTSEASTRAAELAFGEICDYAIQVGGSVTGEHGIGEQKMRYALNQLKAHGASSTIELMRKIKADWDPDNILNPGKFLRLKDDAKAEELERVL
jgi:glycolate oxidase